MVTRNYRILFAATAVIFVAGCHDDGKLAHNCKTTYSTDWRGHGLNLEHTEPADCPVYITSPGLRRETGGTVVDGGTREFYQALLRIKDFSGDEIGYFPQNFGYDGSGRWTAPVYVIYSAGRDDLRPDQASFSLYYDAFGSLGPRATITITYTDAVLANISGPGVIPVGNSQTYTADILAGEAPYTYAWYRDWELVSTSESYTDSFNAEGEVYLRLDITDARGNVDSSTKFVTVSSCTDGSRTC